MDSFATAISLALQHGVPIHSLIEKFKGTRFEPSGFTGNQEIPLATSIMDYLFRWLAIRFLDVDAQEDLGILTPDVRARKAAQEAAQSVIASDTAGPGNGSDGSASLQGSPEAPRREDEAQGALETAGKPRFLHRLTAGSRAAARGLDLGPACSHAAHGSCYTLIQRQQHRLRLTGRSPAW